MRMRRAAWFGMRVGGYFALVSLSFTGLAAVTTSSPEKSQLPSVIDQFTADTMGLTRAYTVEISPVRIARFEKFYSDELAVLEKMNFNTLSEDDKVDYLLLKNRVTADLHQLIEKKRAQQTHSLIPFAKTIEDLEESRRKMERPDPEKAAGALTEMVKQIAASRKALDPGPHEKAVSNPKINPVAANRAALAVQQLSGNLREWHHARWATATIGIRRWNM